MNDQTKANIAFIPAFTTSLVLAKKVKDEIGFRNSFSLSKSMPIYRKNKVLTTIYLVALGVQTFYTFRGIYRDYKEATATLEEIAPVIDLPTYDLVGVDNTTQITVCQDEGHGGDDVHMQDGLCPMFWEHVTEWEKVMRDGKASNNGLQG